MAKRAREAEEMKKRKAIRARFRGLIRSVVFNRIWLMDQTDQKLSLNVKKNIAMLVRPQRKIGMLTLHEKALLHTHHSLRSVEDRKRLVLLLAGLTCFSRIPPKIVARLVPVIKFLFIGRGRTIIKEGDMALTLYFILSGEVEVTRRVWDGLKCAYVDKVEAINGPGDSLGEIEIIENIPRKQTFISTSEVELLVIHDEDFDEILRPEMSKQWNDKKQAFKALDYFNFLTEEQLIAGCKIAIIREFNPLETIYYEDKGHVSYVHFVISGECMILQCLKMKVTVKKGKRSFELVDISKDNADMFEDMTNNEMIKILKEEQLHRKTDLHFDINLGSIEDVQNERTKRLAEMKKMDIESIEKACAALKVGQVVITGQAGQITEIAQPVVVEEEVLSEQTEGKDNEDEMFEDAEWSEHLDAVLDDDSSDIFTKAYEDYQKNSRSSLRRQASTFSVMSSRTQSQLLDWKENLFNQKAKRKPKKKKIEIEADLEDEEKIEGTRKKSTDWRVSRPSSKVKSDYQRSRTVSAPYIKANKRIESIKEENIKIENHFIDVGSLTFSGIFGLGEKLEHRVIMARTNVQCLMVPRFWLFEKQNNPGNIWQRRRFYLDSTIPSRQKLYENFLTTRKWQKFKNDLVLSNLDQSSNGNPTKVQDVPIICRIVETTDD